MDESVRRAMEKWPDVPALHGWVGLDESGHWLLKQEPITHPGLVAFIGRNYGCDEAGRWYFQNGPQRGFVHLAYTPWVLHVDNAGTLRRHTGEAVERVTGAYVDEDGQLLLDTAEGVGLVETGSLGTVADWLTGAGDEDPLDALQAIQRGESRPLALAYGGERVEIAGIRRADVPQRFGFDPDPQPDA